MDDFEEAKLYRAVMSKKKDKVLELCKKFSEGPFRIVTIHKDTVLHMALHSNQVDLVGSLLNEFPPHIVTSKITQKNVVGNTILHEAATYNKFVPAAMEMLDKAPQLLCVENKYGETALYRAARYGQTKMFKFLHAELNKQFGREQLVADRNAFFQKKDKSSTILHTTIVTEHFDLALWIAKKYEYLVGMRDESGMTALQLLAHKSSAFKRRGSSRCLNCLIRSGVSTEDDFNSNTREEAASCCRFPRWEALRNEKQRYESAVELAKFLIEKDASWKATKSHEDRESSSASEHEQAKEGPKTPTPLFLATQFGCVKIVEEILKVYPQAVEHIGDKGRTILHLAIKYRQIEVFDIVEKMKLPMGRLIRKTDENMNSILHMVGEREDGMIEETMQSPVLKLQEDLLLFERVKKICSVHFFKHLNIKGQSAEDLLVENSEKLRGEAEEWLKSMAKNCSIVAVFIATVAFTAAYTVPGGSNSNTGAPILLNQPFFVIYTVADVLSLAFTLTSVILFLSILTSSFRLQDFKQSLPQRLMLGLTFLIFSVSMMMVAFAATIILMIRNKEQWTKIALYTVAFLPVSVFTVSYLPLYLSFRQTFKYTIEKIGAVLPQISSI